MALHFESVLRSAVLAHRIYHHIFTYKMRVKTELSPSLSHGHGCASSEVYQPTVPAAMVASLTSSVLY